MDNQTEHHDPSPEHQTPVSRLPETIFRVAMAMATAMHSDHSSGCETCTIWLNHWEATHNHHVAVTNPAVKPETADDSTNDPLAYPQPLAKASSTHPTTETSLEETFRCNICDNKEYPITLKQLHIGAYRCKTCGEVIHPHTRREHAVTHGAEGRELRKRKWSENANGECDPNQFYCESCEKLFRVKDRRIHQTPPWECEVCEKKMHLAWKKAHITGAKHLKKAKCQDNQIGELATDA